MIELLRLAKRHGISLKDMIEILKEEQTRGDYAPSYTTKLQGENV